MNTVPVNCFAEYLLSTVQTLGADVNARDRWGCTPIFYALMVRVVENV